MRATATLRLLLVLLFKPPPAESGRAADEVLGPDARAALDAILKDDADKTLSELLHRPETDVWAVVDDRPRGPEGEELVATMAPGPPQEGRPHLQEVGRSPLIAGRPGGIPLP